jgi:hypothetical protein
MLLYVSKGVIFIVSYVNMLNLGLYKYNRQYKSNTPNLWAVPCEICEPASLGSDKVCTLNSDTLDSICYYKVLKV